MTSVGGSASKGYKIDPDKMREALKLAQSMLDELDQRGGEIGDLIQIASPASDPTSVEYTTGQEVGARKSASGAGQKYGQAYQAQVQYLGQLIPQLQSALSQYESNEDAAAASAQSHKGQV